MVGRVFIYAMVGLSLTVALVSRGFAQKNIQYTNLSKYRNWSFVLGPVLYKKAKIYPEYGDYTFTNKPIPGYCFGFEYDFHPERKWAFVSGLLCATEPVYNIRYSIQKEDLYPQFTEDFTDKAKSYSIFSFSVPLLLRLNIQSGVNSFFTFMSGVKIMYFPNGEAYFSLVVSNEDMTESREIFGLNVQSQNNPLYESFILSSGLTFTLNKILLKANLNYVMNFRNTIEGYYQYDNLFVSPAAGGKYELSGNYLGLLFSIRLKKKNV